MKISIPFLLVLLFIAGCKEEQKTRSRVAAPNVKNVRLKVLNDDKSRVIFGDTLHVQLSFDAADGFQSMKLYAQRNDVSFSQSDSMIFSIPTQKLGGGYHGLRAEVTLNDSTTIRGSASVRVILAEPPAEWGYRIIEVFPHDKKSYTQGLVYNNGQLYESAGRYGFSDIRRVTLHSGEVEQNNRLGNDYFAEGLALYNNELYQLTWQENEVFVYDLETLERKRSFESHLGNGEGWGLCYNDDQFIFSDGSADLRFIDPQNWSETSVIRVFDDKGDLSQLNELEYVAGKIYANILNEEKIAVIDPQTGAVLAYWNFEGVLETQSNPGRVDVMNGIAYRADHRSFLVTGKLWPYLFEVAPVY